MALTGSSTVSCRKYSRVFSSAISRCEILLLRPTRKFRFSKTRLPVGKASSRVPKAVLCCSRKSDHGFRFFGHHLSRGLVIGPFDVSCGSGSMANLENTEAWQAAMYSSSVVRRVCPSEISARCRSFSARRRSPSRPFSASSARCYSLDALSFLLSFSFGLFDAFQGNLELPFQLVYIFVSSHDAQIDVVMNNGALTSTCADVLRCILIEVGPLSVARGDHNDARKLCAVYFSLLYRWQLVKYDRRIIIRF